MSIPILRYVDILIGLAVVVLMACTLVTAVVQLILSTTFTRARYLRDGLEDLTAQIDPRTLAPHKRYIAERLLRHPLVARDNTVFGNVSLWLRNRFRRLSAGRLPLPNVNPADTLQREEVVLLLLEWASGEGAFAEQDRRLTTAGSEEAKRLEAVRQAVRDSLSAGGVDDPAQAASAIRLQMMQNECAHPGDSSQNWRAQAVVAAVPHDFAARIHCWYDNTIARVSDNYSLVAKVWVSMIAFLAIAVIQLDAVSLLRLLSQDDKLRADLVSEAELESRRYEEARGKLDQAKTDPARTQDLQATAENASRQREQIAASLAALRDPNRGFTPSYLLWQPVAHARICRSDLTAAGSGRLEIVSGPDVRTSIIDSSPDLDKLAAALRKLRPPVSLYPVPGEPCVALVAQTASAGRIQVTLDGKAISHEAGKSFDREGFGARLPGVLLMWVFVTLGAPFWYDLLKNLLGFRSMLAKKDDSDRITRDTDKTAQPGKA